MIKTPMDNLKEAIIIDTLKPSAVDKVIRNMSRKYSKKQLFEMIGCLLIENRELKQEIFTIKTLKELL